jgi:hypothetical protein
VFLSLQEITFLNECTRTKENTIFVDTSCSPLLTANLDLDLRFVFIISFYFVFVYVKETVKISFSAVN